MKKQWWWPVLLSPKRVPTDPCPSGTWPKVSQFNSPPYNPGNSWTAACSWSLKWMSLCINPLRTVSWSPTALHLSQTKSLLVFKVRFYGDYSFQNRFPEVGKSVWGSNTLLLREKIYGWDIPPFFESPHYECQTWQDCISDLFIYLRVASSSSYINYKNSTQIFFSLFWAMVVLYLVIIFKCLWKDMSSGSTYSTI